MINLLFLIPCLFMNFQQVITREYGKVENVLIGIGTLGTYPLYKNFWEKTDKQIIDEAYKVIDIAKENCNKQIIILDNKFNITNLTESQKEREAKKINEDIENKIAISLKNKKLKDYLKLTTKNLTNLKDMQNIIINRLEKLKKDNKNNKEMEELLNEIELLITKLRFVRLYLNSHKNYFELFEFIKKLNSIYEQEIQLFDKDTFFSSDFRKIISKKFTGTYPYLDFAKNLEYDIKNLNKKIKIITKYPRLITDAENLRDNLLDIQDYIVETKEYIQEQKDKNRSSFIIPLCMTFGAVSAIENQDSQNKECKCKHTKKEITEKEKHEIK